MRKSIYLFITLILGVDCWNLIILDPVLNNRTNPVYAVAWALLGFYWFRSRPGNFKKYNYNKYRKYFYWLTTGFLLSIFPAYIFWNQDFITSLVVNRHLIWYIFLPLILYIQPSEKEIMTALFYYTVTYMAVWIIQAITPNPLTTSLVNKIELGITTFELEKSEFGYLLPGYSIMLILLYFKTQQFTENVKLKTFIPAAGMLAIFFILQNRGTLFFAVIVFGYSIFKLRTRYKPILFLFYGLIVILVYLATTPYWNALIQETTGQLNNQDYARWKSFYYYVFEYSPHWSCNIFGNGFLSTKVESGRLLQQKAVTGYYQSDIGIIGLWSMYGILPLIVIYTVISKILFRKLYPFYLKAMAAHILFVPIAWSFDLNGSLIFIIIFYLFAFFTEKDSLNRGPLVKLKSDIIKLVNYERMK
jgi:hypothetical protein